MLVKLTLAVFLYQFAVNLAPQPHILISLTVPIMYKEWRPRVHGPCPFLIPSMHGSTLY